MNKLKGYSFLKSVFALLLLCLPAAMRAEEGEADRLVAQFDNSGGTVKAANQFFDYLDKEEFTDTRIQFAANTPIDSLRQQVWYWAAEWYNDVHEYARAKDYALKALPLFRWPNNGKSDCLNLLGIINVRLSDFPAAASYAKKCVEIDMTLGDPDKISSGLNTLAGIYMAADHADEAEKFILQGLEYADRADNPGRKAILLGMASEIYHKLGRDDKSLDYARKAFALDSTLVRTPKMAMRLSQMASALAGLRRYKEAESTYLRAIAMLKDSGNRHSEGIALNQLGFVYLEQERQHDAIGCFTKAAAIFSQMGDLYNNVHSHKGLYESYWSLNPDSAKIALERYNTLKDSLYQQASADALAKYNAEFGRDRLLDEIKQTRAAHTRNIIIAVVLILALAAAAAMIIRARSRRHRAQMSEIIKKVETLQCKCDEAEKSLLDQQKEASLSKATYEAQNEGEKEFLTQLFSVVAAALTNKDYGVAKIAAMMHMTERTFSRRLKEVTGQSPKMFISAIQMERCAKLLVENPDKTIGEIANLCGFDEASGFSHAFKRVYGCSPTAYREQHKRQLCLISS